MINKRNIVTLEGGLIRDAVVGLDGKILEFSIGVDNAGSEKGVDKPSGFFDCKAWMTPSDYAPAAFAQQVKSLLDDGILVKGARVGVVGRLQHERWKNQEGKTSSRVVILVESLDCWRRTDAAGGASRQGSTPTAATAGVTSSIDDF